jgi:hypothetical protein
MLKREDVKLTIEMAPKQYEKELAWDTGTMYCFSLDINGKTGWRLPTISDVQDLWFHYDASEIDGIYWTNQTTPGEDFAWAVDSDGIDATGYDKYMAKLMVRPVRDIT